ncbi:uncharacterized protein H6S33_009146 [Morchella sextelata]|uniref:uncharacterized protein n=1 Tax=Morchella sextelata TaxID=1174677 RepID=UPI001D042CD6|nr:uncharacterized protein H6S33_009146 [Morchella sextelata]KAH0612766.1 hypothetical protein H6S33_009146 [Morchella sextelata]
MRTSHRRAVPVTNTRTKPSFFSRITGRRAAPRGTTTTTTTTTTRRTHRGGAGRTAAPVHQQRRRPSIGDKISGALMKLRGSLTRRPGMKAAGTRRMRGTDGRGSHAATTRTTRRY